MRGKHIVTGRWIALMVALWSLPPTAQAGEIGDGPIPGPLIAAGWYHSLGLKTDGTIIGWGLKLV